MAAELNDIACTKLKDLLESTTNLHQSFTAVIGLTSATPFADWSRPEANSVETLANVDDNAHHFIVIIIFQGLANGSELSMEP